MFGNQKENKKLSDDAELDKIEKISSTLLDIVVGISLVFIATIVVFIIAFTYFT
ncbi:MULTISPECIES: hypothetical protein [Enterobacterales]|uniref:hypothetical protein n=1 Tax=Enterobacterales TaxID=91347 RepID=UPI000B05164E|nr:MULTISPECIES: hypothetical protein [Enterobacterales]MCK9782551.1 hypothetical protein [Proteus columbae]MCT6518226.1 hypothetical protein [Proteus vulgaris]WOO51314.1 hypothetical protein R2S03_09210 [Hafnia alvei]WPF05787.1 hypothetical protein SB028_08060 [Proteus vulgaris]